MDRFKYCQNMGIQGSYDGFAVDRPCMFWEPCDTLCYRGSCKWFSFLCCTTMPSCSRFCSTSPTFRCCPKDFSSSFTELVYALAPFRLFLFFFFFLSLWGHWRSVVSGLAQTSGSAGCAWIWDCHCIYSVDCVMPCDDSEHLDRRVK